MGEKSSVFGKLAKAGRKVKGWGWYKGRLGRRKKGRVLGRLAEARKRVEGWGW